MERKALENANEGESVTFSRLVSHVAIKASLETGDASENYGLDISVSHNVERGKGQENCVGTAGTLHIKENGAQVMGLASDIYGQTSIGKDQE